MKRCSGAHFKYPCIDRRAGSDISLYVKKLKRIAPVGYHPVVKNLCGAVSNNDDGYHVNLVAKHLANGGKSYNFTFPPHIPCQTDRCGGLLVLQQYGFCLFNVGGSLLAFRIVETDNHI
jgi:hypothetical protein